jgi:hypothetical protein
MSEPGARHPEPPVVHDDGPLRHRGVLAGGWGYSVKTGSSSRLDRRAAHRISIRRPPCSNAAMTLIASGLSWLRRRSRSPRRCPLQPAELPRLFTFGIGGWDQSPRPSMWCSPSFRGRPGWHIWRLAQRLQPRSSLNGDRRVGARRWYHHSRDEPHPNSDARGRRRRTGVRLPEGDERAERCRIDTSRG